MARSRTAAGRRLLLGRPRWRETRLAAPRCRNALTSRNTCRRRKPIRSPASWIVMRPASRSSRTSSRENSLSLIDTTVIGPILLQPQITGECHPNFAQGCHLYIAVTRAVLISRYYGTPLSRRALVSCPVCVSFHRAGPWVTEPRLPRRGSFRDWASGTEQLLP